MPNPAARNANRVAKRVSARSAEEFIRCPIVEWRKQGTPANGRSWLGSLSVEVSFEDVGCGKHGERRNGRRRVHGRRCHWRADIHNKRIGQFEGACQSTYSSKRPPMSAPPIIATPHAVDGPADLFHLATRTWLVVIRRRATGPYGEPLDTRDKCRLPRAPLGHGIESHRQER